MVENNRNIIPEVTASKRYRSRISLYPFSLRDRYTEVFVIDNTMAFAVAKNPTSTAAVVPVELNKALGFEGKGIPSQNAHTAAPASAAM
jgi:hypothetical protein